MKYIFFFAILLIRGVSYGQNQYGIELSFTKYSCNNFEFGIRNNTDTTVRFSFENIVEKNGKNILNYYKISNDTLVCELLPEKKLDLKIHSSEPLNFRIDGEPYYQRTILSNGELKLVIHLKRRYFKSINHLKIVLPDGKAFINKL